MLGLRSIGALPVGLSDINRSSFDGSVRRRRSLDQRHGGPRYVLGQSAESALQGGFGLMGLVLPIALLHWPGSQCSVSIEFAASAGPVHRQTAARVRQGQTARSK